MDTEGEGLALTFSLLQVSGHGCLPSPELPREITILRTLALDLLWTWSHEGDALWSYVDAQLWEKTRNPWVVLQTASTERLNELARDRKFLDQLSNLQAARERYFVGVFPGRKANRRRQAFLNRLKPLQDSLGELNDITVNQHLSADLAAEPVRERGSNGLSNTAFAAGLLSGHEQARLEGVLTAAEKAFRRCARVKHYW